jgi:uncharacterized protein YecE (DUF72 family)
MMSKLRIGTSAWSDHDPFYPPGIKSTDQLPFYAKYFPIVEINMTYYRVPTRRMAQGWVARTPDGFMFDVKPPRELTSTPETPRGEAPTPDADLASEFGEAIRPLADANKLGAITFQFPPSYRNTEEHRDYIKLLPELFPDYHIAVEFRRRDWLDEDHAEETLQLLADSGLSYTMADEPQMGSGSVPPVYGITNPRLAIIRFHGRNYETWYRFQGSSRDRFNWEYSDEELEEWRPKILAALESADSVHVFFNTNFASQGPENAYRLMDLLGIEHPPLPDHTQPEQKQLFE